MDDRTDVADDVNVLSDEEMNHYFSNMLALGQTIHEATEKLCTEELKKKLGELLKYTHLFMQEYERIHEILEKSFRDLTLKSREEMKSTVCVSEARKLNSSGTPDDLLQVAVASYRSDFRELISPLPRLREKCGVFLKDLREETAAFARQIRSRSRPTLEASTDDENGSLGVVATGCSAAVDSNQPETTESPIKSRSNSSKKKKMYN